MGDSLYIESIIVDLVGICAVLVCEVLEGIEVG